eukprot:6005533-Prymnesium_polylepis.1
MQADSGPGDGAAAAQPAARGAVDVSAKRTVSGALASGERESGSTGAGVAAAAASGDGAPASSDGGPTPSGDGATGAGHMNVPINEAAEVEQPKSKKQRRGGNMGRSGWARDNDHD